MRFTISGADKDSGDDVQVTLDAQSQAQAEQIACDRGILISGITAEAEVDPDLDADAGDSGELEGLPARGRLASLGAAVAPVAKPHATLTFSGNSPAETPQVKDAQHDASAPAQDGHPEPAGTTGTSNGHAHTGAIIEYHIMVNQAAYLLETAVNKYIKDGWEPLGGIAVGTSNNAMQYFQSMVRRR